MLNKKTVQQKYELETVDWYINVFEEGKDTRKIVALYGKLQ